MTRTVARENAQEIDRTGPLPVSPVIMGAHWVFYVLLQLSGPPVGVERPREAEPLVVSARETVRQRAQFESRVGIDAELEILR